MPSDDDPREDAADLSTAARALAYTTRSMPNPEHSYDVLGDLQAALGRVAKSIGGLRRGRARPRMNGRSCHIGKRVLATA